MKEAIQTVLTVPSVDELQAENKELIAGSAEVEKRRSELRSAGKPKGIWKRYSKMQAFRAIRSLRGRASVSVYLYLLNLAGSRSTNSHTVRDLALKIKVETIALRTGLNERTVRRAMSELEGKFIARTAGQRADTIWFLNPDSPGEMLQTSPGNWDLISAQGINSYITFPKDSLPVIYTLNVSATDVYVQVLELVTLLDDEVIWISRKKVSQSGLKRCATKKLLRYSRHGCVEAFDPKTRKPSERWKNPKGFKYAPYEVQDGDFSLDNVSPEIRAALVAEHLGIIIENPTSCDWFPNLTCPFEDCGQATFAISFTRDAYKCHSCGYQYMNHKRLKKARDANMLTAERLELGQGKLCKLVSRVKGIPMDEAIALFRDRDLREAA